MKKRPMQREDDTMGFLSWLGFSKPRDAPMLPDIQDNVRDSGNLFVFGMTHSGAS